MEMHPRKGESQMYKNGDHVVYGVHGVCRIVEQEERTVDRKKVLYYVLEPLSQSDARYYIPAHNQAALAKLRPVMSRKELDALLISDEVRRENWIADENRRKQIYRELINSGDRAALICMVGSLHRHKQAQEAAGRKFHLCDENFLRDAEKLISSEFALILNIAPNQVQEYILSVLNAE